MLIFIGAHVLATLPLPLVALILEAEEKLGIGAHASKKNSNENNSNRRSLTSRIIHGNASALLRLGFLGIISLVACIFYGSFTDIMDFFGAIANSAFLFYFPVVFYVKLKGWRNIPRLELAFHVFILIIGILTTVMGGYQAASNMATSFKPPFT